MRIQPKDLAALAATYQSILTEAHDDTGSAPVPTTSVESELTEEDEGMIERSIDALIGDIGERHMDGAYISAAEEAMEYILQHVQKRLEEHHAQLN